MKKKWGWLLTVAFSLIIFGFTTQEISAASDIGLKKGDLSCHSEMFTVGGHPITIMLFNSEESSEPMGYRIYWHPPTCVTPPGSPRPKPKLVEEGFVDPDAGPRERQLLNYGQYSLELFCEKGDCIGWASIGSRDVPGVR